MVLGTITHGVFFLFSCSFLVSKSRHLILTLERKVNLVCHRILAHGTEDIPTLGDVLSDLPTPSLLIELSLAEKAIADQSKSLDFILERVKTEPLEELDGSIFVHTRVTNTDKRDQIDSKSGSGTSLDIGNVDVVASAVSGGAFLGIGLANHHVGGYYWARGMGMGASLPAHGVDFGPAENNAKEGRLFWRKRGPGSNAKETTDESSNSNDGKRSEWADFLCKGDTVQLIPSHCSEVLRASSFLTLIGVRRNGRPKGADPVVEKIWVRSDDNDCWKVADY